MIPFPVAIMNTGGVVQDKVIERELSYVLNGVFFRVHTMLGRNRTEPQYADAVEQELRAKGIRFEREKILDPSFVGERNGRSRVDFFVEGRIVVELKAKISLDREDIAQVLRYLETLHCKLGILVNFRMKTLIPKRILNPKD